MKNLAFYVLLISGTSSTIFADEGFTKRLAHQMSHAVMPDEIALDLRKLSSAEDNGAVPLAPTLPPGPDRARPVVSTTSGEVTGTHEDNVHTFYEIPYAEPPVENLRFQPPEPLGSSRSVDATRNNQLRCMQLSVSCLLPEITDTLCNLVNMDEDCLVLNVYVPKQVNLSDANQPPDDRLPVMVYIHGGSFAYGSGQGGDGRELANVANIVMVSINYRLGAFGFLVNKEAGKPDIIGNQGHKDQQMALQWVQDNIANFGGDKDRVTIFGGSAGAQAIMLHTVSSKSAPLYLRAIQQSPPAYFTYDTPDESQRVTDILVRRLCNETVSTYDCLMSANSYHITRRQLPVMVRNMVGTDIHDFAEPYRPVIDGVEFTDQPLNLYKAGKWNSDKSMIIGIQTEEMDDFQFLIPDVVPTGEAAFMLATYYVVGIGYTDEVVKKYSAAYPPVDNDYLPAFSKVLSHLIFICPSRAAARLAAQTTTGDGKVYFYANEEGVLNSGCMLQNNATEEDCYYATHAGELRYVLRRITDPSESEFKVENIFTHYWGSFARTGNPSGGLETSIGDFTEWPHYISESEQPEAAFMRKLSRFGPVLMNAAANGKASEPWQSIRIKSPMSELETEYEEDLCDFWDSLGIYMDPIPLPTASTTTKKTTTGAPFESTTSDAKPVTGVSVSILFLSLVVSKIWTR